MPDRLWHDMIFYTTGAVTRLVLAELGQPGYKHRGEYGVYRRSARWNVLLPALERHWRPYLQSSSEGPNGRSAALKAFARQLVTEGGGSG